MMDSPPSSMDEENNNREPGGGCMKKERTAAEIRKSNKPLMERKRRERINNCLQQLKSILMEVTKKESSYYSKLEKADILEMTVKYLKNMKRQQIAVAMGSDPSVLGKYIAGFNECSTEISKYLNTVEGLSPETRTRLMNHLANSLERSSITIATNTAVANLQLSLNQSCGTAHAQPLGIQIPTATPLSTLPGTGGMCLLNQSTPQLQTIPTPAMQLVPAKLPTGELVFLLANQQTVSPSGSGVSVVSTVQNNVNNININPNVQAQLGQLTPTTSTVTGIGVETTPHTINTLSQAQFAFPANISTVSPILITSKGLESPTVSVSTTTSGASTSSSSPESDLSDFCSSMRPDRSRYLVRTSTETPRRPPTSERLGPSRLCSPGTDTDSESDDDIVNNNNNINNNNNNVNVNVNVNINAAREASVIRGPMWRPW